MMRFLSTVLCIIFLCFMMASCNEDDMQEENFIGIGFPPLIPAFDNQHTSAGKQLGRMLFYETKLSRTNSVSCASCHQQEHAFSDANQFSFGVDSLQGNRQAMALFNLGFNQSDFFWDGRANSLRHLALMPIQNELELDETLEQVIDKLSNESLYQDQFSLAFGDTTITEERIGLALEQFLASIVSDNSKYDQFRRGEIDLTSSELRGESLFIGSGCLDCHNNFNFDGINRFVNNGLDEDDAFTDFGRELVTGLGIDRAKFKITTLRNIAVTAPYMHDGRFETLEEVIDHYASGVRRSSTVSGQLIGGFDIDTTEREDLVNFLKTLTDEEFLNNPDLSNPF